MTIPTSLSEARKLPAGVRDALLILLADERDGAAFTWSAASNQPEPRGWSQGPDERWSGRRVSGRAVTALKRKRLATAEQTRRSGRMVNLTDRGRELAEALHEAGRPVRSVPVAVD